MSESSAIEWTDATWNPVVGCQAVSPGCDHCYAARETSGRLRGREPYIGLAADGVFNGSVRILLDRLNQPLRWRRPRRVFVNSMSDLFHTGVSDWFVEKVWDVMKRADWHTFQVLTKRAERMERVVRRLVGFWENEVARHPNAPPPNVWLGVSVESPTYYSRIRHLQNTPAAVRFLSCEPLLGALPDLPLDGIDWVIVGGESGPGARPMHPEWARGIVWQCRKGTHRDWCAVSLALDGLDTKEAIARSYEAVCDCDEASVPVFFKQWGEWAPNSPLVARHQGSWVTVDGQVHDLGAGGIGGLDPRLMRRCGKRSAGRVLDGRTYDEMPARAGRAVAVADAR